MFEKLQLLSKLRICAPSFPMDRYKAICTSMREQIRQNFEIFSREVRKNFSNFILFANNIFLENYHRRVEKCFDKTTGNIPPSVRDVSLKIRKTF